MYEVKAEPRKNRLTITLRGFMADEELKAAADEVIKQASTLGSGFDVLNDISEFEASSAEGFKEIQRAQAFLAERKPRRVVRLVKKVMASLQLQRGSKSTGYDGNTAANLAEAEALFSAP